MKRASLLKLSSSLLLLLLSKSSSQAFMLPTMTEVAPIIDNGDQAREVELTVRLRWTDVPELGRFEPKALVIDGVSCSVLNHDLGGAATQSTVNVVVKDKNGVQIGEVISKDTDNSGMVVFSLNLNGLSDGGTIEVTPKPKLSTGGLLMAKTQTITIAPGNGKVTWLWGFTLERDKAFAVKGKIITYQEADAYREKNQKKEPNESEGDDSGDDTAYDTNMF